MALADAAIGLDGAIQRMLMQRVAAQKYADLMKQQAFENQRQTGADERAQQQLDATTESNRLLREQQQHTYESEAQKRLDDVENAQFSRAIQAREQVPAGTDIPSDSPLYPTLNKFGLLTSGVVKQAGGMGSDFQGPLPTGESPESVANNAARIITTAPTSNQAKDAAAEKARQDQIARENAATAETGRHNKAMEAAALNKPPAVQLITTTGPDGKPVQQFVTKQAGASFAKPTPSIVENRLASAQAVQQTGEDIINKLSDPKYAATLGPMMGRASTLRDFVGNPPPEFSDLAGQIESYALANMGVHGMRSAEGAKQISSLLDKRHTPQSLAATIRGLNAFSQHFLENEGRSPAGNTAPATKPTAAELLQKYGGR